MRKVLYRLNPDHPFDKPGFFHCLSPDIVKDRGQHFSVTIAFIETEDGRMIRVDPEDVKFVSPPEVLA